MKWIFLIALVCNSALAGPPKKANPTEVKVTESYSVASLGLEAEAFRIQQMVFQGKTTYKVAKLVNGILSVEHEMPASAFKQMKQVVQPLLKMESNEDCKTPMRFTFRTSGQGDDQLKLCMEKSNVSNPAKKFSAQAKKLLGLNKAEKVEAPAAEPAEMEKSEEPLPE